MPGSSIALAAASRSSWSVRSRRSAVFRSKLDDSRGEGILQCARSGSVANAAAEWGARFGYDAVARVGLAHLALNEIRVQLNLIHRWTHSCPFQEGL